MDKELNEDARTKQDLLYECSSLESRLSNEIIKNENLEQQVKKQKEVIDKAIEIAHEYAQIDGAHHKTWVIDQMIRELLGTEYDNFIKEYEEDGEYTWDIGIAP